MGTFVTELKRLTYENQKGVYVKKLPKITFDNHYVSQLFDAAESGT